AAAQGAGQVAPQGAGEAALELGEGRQPGQQGVMHGGVGRRVQQRPAGGGDRGDAGGGVEQDGPQRAGGALGSVVAEADVLLQRELGAGCDGGGGDGTVWCWQ